MNGFGDSGSCPAEAAGACGDLVVHIEVGRFAEFFGTRRQLEAEGLFPDFLRWQGNQVYATFEVGRMRFAVRRLKERERKAKRLPVGDAWACRFDGLFGWEAWAAWQIAEKRRDLDQTIYRLSPRGRAEFEVECNKAHAARQDEAFQRLLDGMGVYGG